MAAIAAGCIVAGVVTLLAVVAQTSAGMQLAMILPESILLGCTFGIISGAAVYWVMS